MSLWQPLVLLKQSGCHQWKRVSQIHQQLLPLYGKFYEYRWCHKGTTLCKGNFCCLLISDGINTLTFRALENPSLVPGLTHALSSMLCMKINIWFEDVFLRPKWPLHISDVSALMMGVFVVFIFRGLFCTKKSFKFMSFGLNRSLVSSSRSMPHFSCWSNLLFAFLL